jgi:hypothetical protein
MVDLAPQQPLDVNSLVAIRQAVDETVAAPPRSSAIIPAARRSPSSEPGRGRTNDASQGRGALLLDGFEGRLPDQRAIGEYSERSLAGETRGERGEIVVAELHPLPLGPGSILSRWQRATSSGVNDIWRMEKREPL